MTAERELAEPYLLGVLATAGLDVEYTRGEGDTLYYERDGQEVAALDFVGGYGSTLLGHGNTEVVEHARALLAAGTPIHAQFSRHSYANDVAAELNRIVKRELDDDESYYAIFANSGAEAIEAAMKHAEFERFVRVGTLRAEVEANIAAATAAVDRGEVSAPDLAGQVAGVVRHNEELAGRSPVYLAPIGSFHGKLAGSVQLTFNPDYRAVFRAMAAQARFVPVDVPGALRKAVDEERVAALDLVVVDGAVRVVERDFPLFVAAVLEPIQGEGGIHELPREFVADVQAVSAELGIPVIVDEIQSGMGRTGRFLSSAHLGLRGDYFALAKSLGGGVAKAAVLLIRESRYLRDFEMMHSSTFAKDSFSCLIARKTLEILERDDGAVYRLAAERGGKLLDVLRDVRARFPDVVKDVRGRGLMAGLEFHDQSASGSPELRGVAGSGFFGYFVAGYLLREHGIRLFPTSSAVDTLRFEPSVYVTDEELERLRTALLDTCRSIHELDGAKFAPIA
ncbi:aspartate aminotransferase family protein [Saccharothrix sp. ALI-22-I]|uniref:aspartate aminotransferase family protein n=1 Tax=Saccharothrix sp. ALI-22-I TaxID=1933778 RepID=UPI00097C1397|nr:aminotransferase class III-fold pyridoxal phosphate-dependent enzyme [Saccharothrix sp. ALI-22-I]ONI87641.1 aspartate aminotransferase family protein [Saccharothrix sp. ALI-22-I]